MATRIQIRRGTAAQWTSANPVLASGEPAVETDTGKRKIGDGVTAWTDLPYDLAALTPGPGEVIVGGADGPVAMGMPIGQNRSNLVVSMGDSITSNSGAPPIQTDRGYLSWASMLSDSRIRWGRPYATGGHRTGQIIADHLPQVLAADPRPGWCVVLAGSNDVTGDVPLTTITANLQTMYEALISAGIRPVPCTLPPNDPATTPQRVALSSVNAWISGYAQTRGLPLIDFYGTLADPTNGNYRTGTSSDGVHPTATGAKDMGNAIAVVLAPLVTPSVPPLATDNTGHGVDIANPLMMTDTNADGIPDGWSKIGTPADVTFSLVPETGVVEGNWFTITRTGGTGGVLMRSPTVNVTAGDRLLVGFRAKASALAVTGDQVNVGCRQITPAGPSLWLPLYTWSVDFDPATFANEVVVPADMTNFQVEVSLVSSTGTLAIGQVTIRNLTALGFA